MNKHSLIVAFGTILALSSCSTIQHTSQTAPVNTEVYNLTVADMNVAKQKQTHTIEWKWNPLSTVSLKTQKETATAELLKQTNADVLVEPQYTVKRRGLFRGGSLEVTGFPATYSNFRAMSKEDAEMLAKVNGTEGATVLVNPFVNTSASLAKQPQKKIKKPVLRPQQQPLRRKFVNIFAGPSLDLDENLDCGADFGLMYGSYGRKWGWYAKALGSVMSDHYGDEFVGSVTFGAIKTLSPTVGLFFGTGLGAYIESSQEYSQYEGYYNEANTHFTVPVEVGVNWRINSINLMLGYNYTLPFDDGSGNLNIMIGVGYSF